MAAKCIKLNASIVDPTGGTNVASGVVVLGDVEIRPNPDTVVGGIVANQILLLFRSELKLDEGNQPLNWTTFSNRIMYVVTSAELEATGTSTKDLFYDKALEILQVTYPDAEIITQ